jgi:hypothetical protein
MRIRILVRLCRHKNFSKSLDLPVIYFRLAYTLKKLFKGLPVPFNNEFSGLPIPFSH